MTRSGQARVSSEFTDEDTLTSSWVRGQTDCDCIVAVKQIQMARRQLRESPREAGPGANEGNQGSSRYTLAAVECWWIDAD